MFTTAEIYLKIKEWQMEAGECFLDRFDSYIHAEQYMFWALGKGYLTQERFHLWEDNYDSLVCEASWATRYVYCDDICEGDDVYAVVASPNGWNEGDQNQAFRYLAEFIASSKKMQEEFREFIEDRNNG